MYGINYQLTVYKLVVNVAITVTVAILFQLNAFAIVFAFGSVTFDSLKCDASATQIQVKCDSNEFQTR